MKKVTAYVHTHWDREWYREFEDFRLRLIEVFNEVISAIQNGDLPCFYFDGQTSALEDYLEIYPEKTNLIKNLIKEKKLRIGAFYCSADSFLVSGESLYRNMEIGIKKSKDFGETDFIGYLSDTFGHSHCIPYILKSLNINKACLWRGLGDLNADLTWDGIDVTYLIQGYFQDFLNSSLPIEKKAELLKKYLDKISLKSSENVLLPIGADHLCIPKNLKQQIQELNKIYDDYEIEIATPFEYFEKVKSRDKVSGEFLNNKLNFILPGVYSSRIYVKQANANSQWLLSRIAEPVQAVAHYFFDGKNKQNEIDYAYKTLIKNHAHDSIYGCNTDKVQDEVMQRYEKTDSVSNGIIKRTLRDLSCKDGKFSVINLSNFDYNGLVKIRTNKKLPKFLNAVKIATSKGFTDEKLYNINDIPITEDYTTITEYLIDVKGLSAFSLTNIEKGLINTTKNLSITNSSIENNNIKIEVKNNKISFTDKIKNEIYDDFICFTDRADIGDSYNFGGLKNDKPLSAKLIKFSTKKQKEHRAILHTVFKIEIPKTSNDKGRTKTKYTHLINMDIILENQSNYAKFNLKFNNKSTNHILQIGFNLKEKIFSTINEDLFGTTKRKFNTDYNIYDDIHAPRGIELKPNTSPMQRFVQTQNFGLVTKGNCEYEVNKNTLYLTLLRATGVISNPKNTTRGTPAGPPLETPKLQCLGENTAEFAIAFESDELNMFKMAESVYYPCLTLFTEHESQKFFEINNDNIFVYAIKTDLNGIILRLFNNSNKKQMLNGNEFQSKEIKNIVIKR